MRKLSMVVAALALVGAMAGAAGTVFADSHLSMSEKRVQAMKDVGAGLKAIGQGRGDAAENAGKVKMLMAKMLDLFPKGSAAYRAKPEIWSNWDGFKTAMMNSNAALAKLQTAAQSGDRDATMAALGAVGKTCKGCHTDYRGPKPK